MEQSEITIGNFKMGNKLPLSIIAGHSGLEPETLYYCPHSVLDTESHD